MEAIVRGTSAGLDLLRNIVAMLIVLVALVFLANVMLGLLPHHRHFAAADAWASHGAGVLADGPALGAGGHGGSHRHQTVLKEFIAYVDLSELAPDALDARSRLIMFLCDVRLRQFRQSRHHDLWIGGLGTMAPERQDEINSVGATSIVSGPLTTCLIGPIVRLLT